MRYEDDYGLVTCMPAEFAIQVLNVDEQFLKIPGFLSYHSKLFIVKLHLGCQIEGTFNIYR